MPRYDVRLDVRAARPLKAEVIQALQGSRWDVNATGAPRSRRLAVTMSMQGSDPAGALIRAQNVILDVVPGDVTHAELTLARK